jgi:signal transduction histidine kinase
VLGAALALTAVATITAVGAARDGTRSAFTSDAQAARDRIVARLDTYVAFLRSAAAFFAASDSVTSAEFTRYTDRLNLREHYPGIQGLGYSERIGPRSIAKVVQSMRAAGIPEFHVWPDTARPVINTIVYLEPRDLRNRAALGFDMFTDSTRRRAMELARDNASPAMSGRVQLVQEIDANKQAGFLIYVPVYERGAVPETVAERRRELRGYVYAPFRARDLFVGIFGSELEPRVDFRIFDGARADTSRLLFATPVDTAIADAALADTVGLTVAGRPWTLVFTSAATTTSRWWAPAAYIALAGGAISIVLFVLTSAEARARARMAAARDEAEEANHAKTGFLAAMSHELRTPLNAIAGYADLLLAGVHGPMNDAQRHAIDRIVRSEQHLLSLINDVLNFAKLEAGRIEFHLGATRVVSVIDAVVPMIQPQLEAKRIEFTTAVAPELCVVADHEKLEQILLNILSNAVKFTPEGGRVHVGATGASSADHRVRVRVTDTGIGISPEKHRSIFEPFVQVHRTLSSPVQGTGLGLAISRDLARAMGGDLSVESEEGKGATFTIVLPAAESRSPA